MLVGQPRAERRKETVVGDAAAVKALVVLGCMQVQKGTFLDSAAMDDLLGSVGKRSSQRRCTAIESWSKPYTAPTCHDHRHLVGRADVAATAQTQKQMCEFQKIFRSGEEKGRALKLNKDRRLAQGNGADLWLHLPWQTLACKEEIVA